MTRLLILSIALLLCGCDRPDREAAQPADAASKNSGALRSETASVLGSARTGPFGLTTGMSQQEIEKLVKLHPNPENPTDFVAKTVPIPYEDFYFYRLNIDKQFGLCAIEAGTKEIRTSSHAIELKSEYMKLKDALSKKYGSPSLDVDELRSGTIFSKPEARMSALRRNEWDIFAAWESNPDRVLPNDLRRVGIMAEAISVNEGRVGVVYEFKVKEQCDENRAKEKAKGL